MAPFLRFLRLLAIVLWVGGIAFFAFVLAPVAFSQLPSAHQAGMVVAKAISVLHILGLVSAIVFLAAATLLRRAAPTSTRTPLTLQMLAIAGMLALTLASQFAVLPAMERDRARAGGVIDGLPPADPNKLSFDRLHILSERIEGAVLLLGLAALVLMAREPTPTAQ